MKPLVLIVEDDPALVELLRYNLEKEGYDTAVAADGEVALTLVQEEEPVLIILDWMLPKLSGIEACRRLRQRPNTAKLPIIMLTARGEEDDRIRGLESGADDYIVKPFSPSELIARVRAVLRRSRPELTEEVLSYEGIVMDLATHRVMRNKRPLHLAPTEYRLLRVLLERPGRVFSREQLLDQAWGRDVYVEQRTVDVHVRRLRKVLNAAGEPDIIRTVRGAGYALDTTLG
ncbi:MAG: phosphate regulon transcriptional regulator PhoB [Rhodospirillales bacterium]|jgi:two-component system phosphate regulon response regulator PhoB